MARGATQARRKQPPKPPAKRKRAAPSWEEQLFFSRLRRHAKVMYVVLALVFAVGFVAFGVGSGSTGIGDILRGNFFGGGGGTGSQIKADQKKIKAHPKNIEAYLDLAAIYQQRQEEPKALSTLQRATRVAPKNLDVLNQLAGIYRARADNALRTLQEAQVALAENSLVPFWLDLGTASFASAFRQDQFSTQLTNAQSAAYSKLITAATKAEVAYKRVAVASRGTSQEAGALLQLGEFAAQVGNDRTTAISAFTRFLKIAPDDPSAPAVKQSLKQLLASQPQARR